MILIRFALEWSALGASETALRGRIALCCDIVRFWERHGVLVIASGKEGEVALSRQIGALPQSLRVRLKAALERPNRRLARSSNTLPMAVQRIDDLLPMSGAVDLIGLSDESCSRLGFAANETSRALPGCSIEVACILSLLQSSAATGADELARAQIQRDESATVVWQRRFEPFVPWANHVSIYDRFCGLRAAGGRSALRSGLGFVLSRMWASNAAIDVYFSDETAPAATLHGDQIVNARSVAPIDYVAGKLLRELIKANGARRRPVSIYAAPPSSFKNERHGRYIRMGSHIWSLDIGLQPFEGKVQRQEMSDCPLTLVNAAELEAREAQEARIQAAAGSRRCLLPASSTGIFMGSELESLDAV